MDSKEFNGLAEKVLGLNKLRPEVVYKHEYILHSNQLLSKADAEHILQTFKTQMAQGGVALVQTNITVEAIKQPVAIILEDGAVIQLERSTND